MFTSPMSVAAEGPVTAESVEWLACDADRIVAGTVVTVQPIGDEGESPYAVATVAVSRTLKGEATDRVTFVLSNYYPSIAATWMSDGVPLLFFLLTGDRARSRDPKLPDRPDWVLRYGHDYTRYHSVILLGPEWRGGIPCVTRRYDILTRSDAILNHVASAVESGATNRPEARSLVAPFGTPASRLSGKSLVFLIVPADGLPDPEPVWEQPEGANAGSATPDASPITADEPPALPQEDAGWLGWVSAVGIVGLSLGAVLWATRRFLRQPRPAS
jgi:hypothetical protein